MGTDLSVDLGYGLEIPTDEYGNITSLHIGEEEVFNDLYELFETLNSKYSLLSFEYGSCCAYNVAAAVFIKRLKDRAFDVGIASLDIVDVLISREEESQLREAAKLLNLEWEPKILAFGSYR